MIRKHRYVLLAILIIIISGNGILAQESWSLEKCITHALENNISISQALLKQRTSEIEYTQSRMNRLPSINASASQSLLEPTTTSIGLNASMNIFNGLNTEHSIKRNKLELEKQNLATEQTKFDIEISIAEAYIQVLYYKDNITAAEQVLNSCEKELQLAQAKYKVGAIAQKDLSDIEAQYANNQYALIRAQNMYAQQKLSLKQILELEPGADFEIHEDSIIIQEYEIPNAIDVYTAACGIIPEIKSAEQQKAIDSLSIKIAQSNYYPSLSLSAGIGANGDFFDNESEWSGNKSLRLSLSIPIFNKWQTKTNVETVKINSEYNTLAIDVTKKNLYKEIESACQNAIAYQGELKALELSVKAAEESYNLTQKQFKVGATDATSLILAQTKYNDAMISLLQAKYMTVLSHMILDHYQGKPISL